MAADAGKAMAHDVFISYSSHDVRWAERLEADLGARGLDVFRDGTRLEAGRKWEKALMDALDASRHLVVLWSSHARESDWVQKELARFDAHVERDARRRLTCVNLEGANVAYDAYQALNQLQGAASPDAVDADAWNAVVSKIGEAAVDDDDTTRIPTAVLALTRRDFEPTSEAPLSEKDLLDIEASVGVGRAELSDRYGAERLDWRPYSGKLTIRGILDKLIGEINKDVPGVRFRWTSISDDFWCPLKTGKPNAVAASLAAARPSLVVIDTVALKHQGVYRRAMLLREHVRGSTCAWVVVPPRPSEPQMLSYRELVKEWSTPLLDAYFSPPVPPREALPSHVGIFCGDDAEMRRLVQGAIGDYLATSERSSRPGSTFTRLRE